jgi:hypothetical protein
MCLTRTSASSEPAGTETSTTPTAPLGDYSTSARFALAEGLPVRHRLRVRWLSVQPQPGGHALLVSRHPGVLVIRLQSLMG